MVDVLSDAGDVTLVVINLWFLVDFKVGVGVDGILW